MNLENKIYKKVLKNELISLSKLYNPNYLNIRRVDYYKEPERCFYVITTINVDNSIMTNHVDKSDSELFNFLNEHYEEIKNEFN